MSIYNQILQAKNSGRKQLAVLIDPDKAGKSTLQKLTEACHKSEVDYLFVGGSLITNGDLGETLKTLRHLTDIPLVIFPGSHQQVDENANAILLLSLISGRNPDLLIGQHVMAAPRLKSSGLEIIPTGYILIDSGSATTVQYVSNTLPLPANKPDVAGCTALAGEQLGMKLIFAEAGSGAENPVSEEMIRTIKSMITVPLIVGGGIRTPEKAAANFEAGADVIVVGNSIEKDVSVLREMCEATKGFRV